MSPNVKEALKWVLGLAMVVVGLLLIVWDARVTEAGKMALHTLNVVVALVISFAGGFIVDPAWAGQLIASIATAAGDFFKAKGGGLG